MTDVRTRLQRQIAAHEMPPYVYTYPPKAAYEPFLGSWQRAAESWRGFGGRMALYLHVPFCEMKCTFCDLFTVTNQHAEPVVDRYVRCLLREIDLMLPYLDTSRITVGSLYFGGGTPTLLSQGHLEAILGKLRASFAIDPRAEVSIEGAPNTLGPDKLALYERIGFNRLSIGIQTFAAEELVKMGRPYDAALGEEMSRAAVGSGIGNVNLDLLYGIPGQTLEAWERNLATAIDIGPRTLTAYPLVIRDRTTLGKARSRDPRNDLMDEENRYEWYDFTVDALAAAGYEVKTLVSYAKTGGGCVHEENEHLGMPTLAFGAGARKYGPTLHYVDDDYVNRRPNQATWHAYMDAIEQGAIPVRSAAELTKEERQRRFVIMGLLASGVLTARYTELFDDDATATFGTYFDALEAEGLLVRGGDALALTRNGKKYSGIISQLLASDFVQQHKDRYR